MPSEKNGLIKISNSCFKKRTTHNHGNHKMADVAQLLLIPH